MNACSAEHREDASCFQAQAVMQIMNFHIRKLEWNLRKGKRKTSECLCLYRREIVMWIPTVDLIGR